jgi:hypothetical protein
MRLGQTRREIRSHALHECKGRDGDDGRGQPDNEADGWSPQTAYGLGSRRELVAQAIRRDHRLGSEASATRSALRDA